MTQAFSKEFTKDFVKEVPVAKITALTAAEKRSLPKYRSKWQAVALSTDRINRKRAASTMKAVYAYANKPAPEILFCDSPNLGMLTQLYAQQKVYTPNYLLRKLRKALNKVIREKVARPLRVQIHDYFFEPRLGSFSNAMFQDLAAQIGDGLEQHGSDRSIVVPPDAGYIERIELSFFAYYDFAKKLVDKTLIDKEWKLMQAIAKDCQWTFMFENVCVICDRPTEIDIPEEGEITIEFSDGVSF
jgi:hypothetical protein